MGSELNIVDAHPFPSDRQRRVHRDRTAFRNSHDCDTVRFDPLILCQSLQCGDRIVLNVPLLEQALVIKRVREAARCKAVEH